MKMALIATVGGRHQPIMVALESAAWDRVVFVVSEDDPMTGSKGSSKIVEGKGRVCKSDGELDAPDLPAVPVQAALPDAVWRDHVVRVPADDITVAIDACLGAMRQLIADGFDVVGDYTGGTKSMTAALAIAAQLTDGVRLQVVTGPRVNLQATTGDLSRVQAVSRSLSEPRLLGAARRAWDAFDYAAAASLLRGCQTVEARRMEALSLGYAAWSNLNYAEAQQRLLQLRRFVAGEHLGALGALLGKDEKNREATMLHDLWLLAARHAEAGRFDMAILVLYRTLEGIAHWSLRHQHGVDPSDVPADSPFAEFAVPSRVDSLVLGLDAAWNALEEHDQGPLGQAMAGNAEKRRGITKLRNQSILAHGANPLGEEDWQRFSGWMARVVRDAFVQVAFGKRTPHGQLPRAMPS